MNVDRRVVRSRKALEEALLVLIEQQDLAELSIADVTRAAGVSRSTFYDHYADLHQLAESACTEMFETLLFGTPVLASADATASENPLAGLFDHVASHQRLYTALLGPDGSARVMTYLHRRLTIATHVNSVVTDPRGRTHGTDPHTTPPDVVAAFTAGALLGALIDWLHRGCPEDSDSMAAQTWPLMLRLRDGYAGDQPER